jgi:hypothetical protein
VLVCNTFGNTVSRHLVDVAGQYRLRSSEVLLRKWLDLPDGARVSPDERWLAVSNHSSHSVLVYAYAASLNDHADPIGILRGVRYPHGLRFTSDGRFLLVADAGAPVVHVYAQGIAGWHGVRYPIATVRIMEDALFAGEQPHPEESGPKGIDVDRDSSVLAVTSQRQRLAFFSLPALLEHASRLDHTSEQWHLKQSAADVGYELGIMQLLKAREKETEASASRLAALVTYMWNSRSWRMTAPLRRLDAILRRS